MHHILIAEDEPRIAAFLEKGLRKYGYHTAIARDGYEAISMAQEKHFQIMLLDLGLPIFDGWTVLDRIRQVEPSLVIIVVTARDSEDDRTESLKRGANDYISKPFKFSDLIERMQTYLNSAVV